MQDHIFIGGGGPDYAQPQYLTLKYATDMGWWQARQVREKR